jgi:MYXO-CTERM domain-containing protein
MRQGIACMVLITCLAWAQSAAAVDGCSANNFPGCGGCACEACTCNMDPFCCQTLWDSLCVEQCMTQCPQGCGPATVCGDGTCDAGEGCDNCAADCGCTAPEFCYQGACCQSYCGINECGGDGCGGNCGSCGAEMTCQDGQCVEAGVFMAPCAENSDCQSGWCVQTSGQYKSCSKACANDFCPAGWSCAENDQSVLVCLPDCLINCGGKMCGPDGCGGSCGGCPTDTTCDAGVCKGPGGGGCEANDYPGCNGCQCEACVCAQDSYCCTSFWDTICVGQCELDCGGCGTGGPCGNGSCEAGEGENCLNCKPDCGCNGAELCYMESCCQPQCAGAQCGYDGCGGSCGTCGGGQVCFDQQCCAPDCAGKVCGDDSCGSSCGACSVGEACSAGECIPCDPDCSGKECGDDGCGGLCGDCQKGEACDGGGQCQELPTCAVADTIVCGQTISLNTEMGDSFFDQYSCIPAFDESGPEMAYQFVPNVDDIIIVDLDEDGDSDLDLFLLETVCISDYCNAFGTFEMAAKVDAGKTYYIVVDGYEGSFGTATLKLNCENDCTPQCGGKDCGDDACGASCGECEFGDKCHEGVCTEIGGFGWPCDDGSSCKSGWCIKGDTGAKVCTSLCKAGECLEPWDCVPQDIPGIEPVSICMPDCVPECDGLECGDDGCGGKCGACPPGKVCTGIICEDAQCDNECEEGQTGCDEELVPWNCEVGEDWCLHPVPQEPCGEDTVCEDGVCICVPDCSDKVCGPDGCGGKCGDCEGESYCFYGQCVADCVPECGDKVCGPDGCGGSCGECIDGQPCAADGLCENPPLDVQAQPDVTADATIADSGPAPVVEEKDGGGSGGCATSGAAPGAAWAFLLLLVGLAVMRRKKSVLS